jgi:hypothetical protein
VDGLFDWYWLGVVLGLGVTAGVALVSGRLSVVAFPIAALGALFIVGATLPYWTGAAFFGGAALAGLSLRTLTANALPAAVLFAAVIAFVPGLGYAEAVATPLLGTRLRRRTGQRYAGLRVLAKD